MANKILVPCLVTFGAVLLGLAVWASVDKGRYTPIYKPIQCTSPSASIPVDLAHVLGHGLNATMTVTMQCTNPNPYKVVMGSSEQGSGGTFLVPNLTDFSQPPIRAGDVTFPQKMVLAPTGEGSSEIAESAILTAAFIKESMPYILSHNKTFPAYMRLSIKADAYAKFMFVTKEKMDVLPQKSCGFYLALTADNKMLNIVPPMVCRNSYTEMEEAVGGLDTTEGPIGFVDNLDPTEETLASLEHDVGVGSIIVMCVGYIACALLWIGAVVRCISYSRIAKSALGDKQEESKTVTVQV